MSGPFRVGDIVECVDAAREVGPDGRVRPSLPGDVRPTKGELYVIQDVFPAPRTGVPSLELDKAPRPRDYQGRKCGWYATRFRLLRRPSDHAEFLASLTRTKAPGPDEAREKAFQTVAARAVFDLAERLVPTPIWPSHAI